MISNNTTSKTPQMAAVGVLLSSAHVGRSENLALRLDGDLVARTDPLVSLGDKDRDLANYLIVGSCKILGNTAL